MVEKIWPRMHLWYKDPDTGEEKCMDDLTIGVDKDGVELVRWVPGLPQGLGMDLLWGEVHSSINVIPGAADKFQRALLMFNQDEAVYKQLQENGNCEWGDGKTKAMKSKTTGQARMMSAIVSAWFGLLNRHMTPEVLKKANELRSAYVKKLKDKVNQKRKIYCV